MKCVGYLIITKKNAADFENLQEITGSLDIRADASLPVLTSVGGSLDISADASLPVLTSVGGSLYISADASLPVLSFADGESITMHTYKLGMRWPVFITDAHMRIGCQRHTHAEWSSFSDRLISKMDSNAIEFWTANKSELLELCAKTAGK